MTRRVLTCALFVTLFAFGLAGDCRKTDEHVSAPSQASPLQRLQINESLSLQGRYPMPKTSFDRAFEANTWQEFADRVGTQDFSVDFLVDAAGNEYVHFDYGLGDNDFGSVHHRNGPAEPLIAVNDGDWTGIGAVPASLVSCLEDAAEGLGRAAVAQQVAQPPPTLEAVGRQQENIVV